MTDLDDRLRRDLATLADRMPVTDIADGSVRRGKQRRMRRATIAATAGIAIVVAAIIVPITLAGRSTQHHPSPRATNSAGPTSPTLDPSDGGKYPAWEVAAPVLGSPSEPPPLQKQCRRDQIHATAQTRPTPHGVVGVVSLVGHNCTPYTKGPAELRSATGLNLMVGYQRVASSVDQAANFPTPSGYSLNWGFTWSGSWCGTRAASVVIPPGASPVASKPTPRIVAPLTGPSPACHGTSRSVLVPGITGATADGEPDGQGDPVETSPADWSGLRAQLHVPPISPGIPFTGFSVTLRNTTGRAIILSPCPAYRMAVSRHNSGELFHPRALTCPPQPRTVPAHGSILIPLRGRQGAPARSHRRITFGFAIAGVPPSTVTVRVG